MEHLVKLLRDSYDLQEEKSEESAYWHLQQLRSEIKQLTLTDVMRSDCEIEGIVEQNKDYVLGFYTGDELKEYLSNNYA